MDCLGPATVARELLTGTTTECATVSGNRLCTAKYQNVLDFRRCRVTSATSRRIRGSGGDGHGRRSDQRTAASDQGAGLDVFLQACENLP